MEQQYRTQSMLPNEGPTQINTKGVKPADTIKK